MLGHSIEHSRGMGSHMTFTVQYKMFYYAKGEPCGMGG